MIASDFIRECIEINRALAAVADTEPSKSEALPIADLWIECPGDGLIGDMVWLEFRVVNCDPELRLVAGSIGPADEPEGAYSDQLW